MANKLKNTEYSHVIFGDSFIREMLPAKHKK